MIVRHSNIQCILKESLRYFNCDRRCLNIHGVLKESLRYFICLYIHISNLILPSLVDLEIDAIIGCCKSHCLQGNKEIKTLLSCVFALAVDTYFRCCRRVSVALSLCQSVRLSSVFFLPFHFNFFSHSSLIFRCVCLLISKCLLKTLKLKYELDFGICFAVSPFLCSSVSLLFSCCCRCFSPT